jgi:predicted N-acetyltransferase YhbS
MSLGKREPSGREKDEAAVEQLAQLREKLHVDDISKARKAAFNLSWMQEDGLEILTEALFGNFQRTTKKAAAYGLRSMHGRRGRAVRMGGADRAGPE